MHEKFYTFLRRFNMWNPLNMPFVAFMIWCLLIVLATSLILFMMNMNATSSLARCDAELDSCLDAPCGYESPIPGGYACTGRLVNDGSNLYMEVDECEKI